jgi:hypothetical protein
MPTCPHAHVPTCPHQHTQHTGTHNTHSHANAYNDKGVKLGSVGGRGGGRARRGVRYRTSAPRTCRSGSRSQPAADAPGQRAFHRPPPQPRYRINRGVRRVAGGGGEREGETEYVLGKEKKKAWGGDNHGRQWETVHIDGTSLVIGAGCQVLQARRGWDNGKAAGDGQGEQSARPAHLIRLFHGRNSGQGLLEPLLKLKILLRQPLNLHSPGQGKG